MLTPERYSVLRAISVGDAYRLWPMMRRAFLRARLIKPNGEPPAPSDKRRAKQPHRPYRVTRRGRSAMAEFEATIEEVPSRVPSGLPTKPQFGVRRGIV